MHALLHGESGNGKSWLYKTALRRMGVPYVVVNCASIVNLNSVAAAILSAVVKPGTPLKISFTETKGAGVKALVAEGNLEISSNFDLHTSEPMLRAFTILSKRHTQRRLPQELLSGQLIAIHLPYSYRR